MFSFFKTWKVYYKQLYALSFFLYSRNVQTTFVKNPKLKIICFQSWFLIKAWSDKAVKGTIVSPALPSLHGIWKSLEIMLLVTLRTKVEVTDQNRTYV